MREARDDLVELKAEILQNSPMHGLLEQETVKIIDNLAAQADKLSRLELLPNDERDKIKDALKERVEAKIEGVNITKNALLIRQVSKNVNEIKDCDLCESLTKENLQDLLKRVTDGALDDIDDLEDKKSPSGLKFSAE